jgi:probable HAF family extracellular repeat protein
LFPQITTEALGINDAREIVGLFSTSGGLPQAFLDSNGVLSLVDGPPSRASGINSADQIVGSISLINETGFVDTNGVLSIVTLPFSNFLFSEGHSVNDSGQVVGVYFTPGTPEAHSFLDTNGAFSSIDVPGAYRHLFIWRQ